MKKLVLLFLIVFISNFVIAQDDKNVILITNVNVWDGTSDNLIKADVLIENNLITEVKANIKAPKEASTLDGRGGTLMPGLIEGHGHLYMNGTSLPDIENNRSYDEIAVRGAARAKSALMSGFTTWRDAGGMGT
ncbi:MAG: hypothetical protein KAK04_16160 [Cyclobacteriaceae bacterium]|nr:hypothetical protein [Cyclobacteriaceae bacterium]